MDDLEDPPRKNRAAQWDDQMAWTPCWSPVHFFRCQVPQSGWFTQKGPKSLFSRVKRISRKYIYIFYSACWARYQYPLRPSPLDPKKPALRLVRGAWSGGCQTWEMKYSGGLRATRCWPSYDTWQGTICVTELWWNIPSCVYVCIIVSLYICMYNIYIYDFLYLCIFVYMYIINCIYAFLY
jgi:hypothetical protein